MLLDRAAMPRTTLLLLASSLAGCAVTGPAPDPCDGASAGEACLWAGTGEPGYNTAQAYRLASLLYQPTDVTFGGDGRAYIADSGNHMIRRVDLDGTIVGVVGVADEADGALRPIATTFGPDGQLYIVAWHDDQIRRFAPASGIVTTVPGDFDQPSAIAFGPDGSMYVLDQHDLRLRRLASDGMISTIAIDLVAAAPSQVAGALLVIDHDLYVSDSPGHRIRRIDLATGAVDSPPITATLGWPLDLALGPDGRLYVADRDDHAIRVIDLATGVVETVLASDQPYGLGFDGDGDLYVADTRHDRIVKVLR